MALQHWLLYIYGPKNHERCSLVYWDEIAVWNRLRLARFIVQKYLTLLHKHSLYNLLYTNSPLLLLKSSTNTFRQTLIFSKWQVININSLVRSRLVIHPPKVLGVVYESKGKNQIIEKMRYDMRMYLNNFLHTGLSPRTTAIKTFLL